MNTENIDASTPVSECKSYADHPFGIYNIELTNKCPMKCVMCPRTKNMTRAQGFMDYALFQCAVDELASAHPSFAKEHVVWLHHFGESLLHPRFGDCIRYALSKGVLTGLSINPFMLTEPVAEELIGAAPSALYISLDGHDDESFYKIRGMKKGYQVSHDRLMDFLKLKNSHGAKTQVVVSMIDFPMNEESIQARESYWKNIAGVDRFLCKDFSTWDGNSSDINSLAERGRDAGAVDTSAVVCTLLWEVMTVMWNGDVVPCCYDYDAKVVLGNMGEQTLSDIWNGEKMQALRKEFIANQVANPLCKNCEKLYLPQERRRF
jgi:radical SAM protein with 4Fe4S-binding SPASM domain